MRVTQVLARYYFKNRQIDTAEKMVAEILEVRPNDFATCLLSGEILISKNEFTQAIDLLNRPAKRRPTRTVLNF